MLPRIWKHILLPVPPCRFQQFGSVLGRRKIALSLLPIIWPNRKKTLLDILDCGAGERQPETFDVCDPYGHFQWLYHRRDKSDRTENKSGGGHFHLFATPKFFADPLGVHHSHLIAIELDGMADERVTIIVPSLSQAAFEVHRQNMWERGYRLENKINSQKYFASDGYEITHLFEGKTMYAATFVKRH